MNERIAEKTEGRVSYHDSVEEMLKRIREDGMSNAFKALRLGLATIYTAQIGLEMVQDILYGTPAPHEVVLNLSSLLYGVMFRRSA